MTRNTLKSVTCLLVLSGFAAPATVSPVAFGSAALGSDALENTLHIDDGDADRAPTQGGTVETGCDLGAGGICLLPVEAGPCDGVCPRYFHNPCTGQCEPFIYGCCGGNANNFETLEECQAACVVGPGEPIPTVSAWGIVVLALLLMTSGKLAYRRVAQSQPGCGR